MANKIFQALAKEKIELFKSIFAGAKELFWDEEQAKLIHPGEFGSYRETIVKDFIRLFIPGKFEIDSGFVISPNGGVSNQCDLIVFDAQSTPLMQSLNNQKFFPVETVVAVGEVKSDMQSKSSLSTALEKLAKIKVMREEVKEVLWLRRESIGDYDPVNYPFDQVFTFLICKNLGFAVDDVNKNPLRLYRAGTLPRHKHNIVLSVEDGVLTYHNGESNYYYPSTGNKIEKEVFIKPNATNTNLHFVHFISALLMGVKFATILSPDIAMYLTDDVYFGGLQDNIK